jgi:hypothetical protein
MDGTIDGVSWESPWKDRSIDFGSHSLADPTLILNDRCTGLYDILRLTFTIAYAL